MGRLCTTNSAALPGANTSDSTANDAAEIAANTSTLILPDKDGASASSFRCCVPTGDPIEEMSDLFLSRLMIFSQSDSNSYHAYVG